MPQVTLDRCPDCARWWHGLPPAGRCPDCGFEYDEHTVVWRSDESWGRLALVYTGAGLVAGVAVSVLYRLSVEDAPFPLLPLLLGVIAPALGLAVRRLIGGRITGRFVALTTQGIVVGTRGRPRLVRWEEFDRLIEERGVPKLRCHGSSVPIPIDDVFESASELAAFAGALREAARRRGHQRP